MKTIIIAFILFFSFNSLARTSIHLDLDQQKQLIQTLNQMDPEIVDTILNDEAYDWYMKQLEDQRQNAEGLQAETTHAPVISTGPVKGIGGDFNDPNAPQLF
jgi:hypothetical protein